MKILRSIAALAVCICIITPSHARAAAVGASPPETAGYAVCVMDAGTGIVLAEKNAAARLYPASITKVMTALLLLEYAEENLNGQLTERVLFSKNAVFGIEPGSSSIAMDFDETLTLEQCLYAMLLPSANEVCMAVAEHISGTVEDFAVLMTSRAKALGCTGTQFTNPHGLPDESHYTTARDMALIMREAATHDVFREIIATSYYEIPPTEKLDKPRQFPNSNRLIQQGVYYYEPTIGGKTGYTDDARHTLVTLNEKDGKTLIISVMKTEKNEIYTDTIALADYGFTRYKEMDVLKASDYITELDVTQAYEGEDVVIGGLYAVPDKDVSLFLPIAADGSIIERIPVLDEAVSAPVRKGEIVGQLALRYAGMELATVNLIAAETIDTLDATALAARLAQTQTAFNPSEEAAGEQITDNAPAAAQSAFSIWKILLFTGIFFASLIAILTALQVLRLSMERKRRRSRRRGTRAYADDPRRRQTQYDDRAPRTRNHEQPHKPRDSQGTGARPKPPRREPRAYDDDYTH